MILSWQEVIAIIVMTVVVGWIFSDLIKPKKINQIDLFLSGKKTYSNIWMAMAITAPAILLHEFGHKFVAMAFGYAATFNVFIGGLAIAVVLKLLAAPFLILAPAYVSIPISVPPLIAALVAFAGPFVNLLLWIGSKAALKIKNLSENWIYALTISAKLNLFLFVFNLIPFPPLDGYHVLMNLIEVIF